MKNSRNKPSGRHGGMWKVAYADFVTAMMAFFMLLWLLGTVPKDDLEGIAKYFSPIASVGANNSMSDSSGNKPDSPKGMVSDSVTSGSLVHFAPPSGALPSENDLKAMFSDTDSKNFISLIRYMRSNKQIKEYAADNNLAVDTTSEGLRIRIKDSAGSPMFIPNSDIMQPTLKDILQSVASAIKTQPNYIRIVGHTACVKSGMHINLWTLAMNRAYNAKLFLTKYLDNKNQVIQLQSDADKNPIDPSNPASPENIGIDIILLNSDNTNQYLRSAP